MIWTKYDDLEGRKEAARARELFRAAEATIYKCSRIGNMTSSFMSITKSFDINKVRVASPCSVGWETMTGDDRVRRCHSCQLNIYNTAEMTKNEVEHLIQNRENRLCIRLYKRGDGTILTKDCPAGLRAYQKRLAHMAGAALTAVLGIFSISHAQKDDTNTVDTSKIQKVASSLQDEQGDLMGTIVDQNGATVPGAVLKLFKGAEKKALKIARSTEEGRFNFKTLSTGIYRLEIKLQGFKKLIVQSLEIRSGKNHELNLVLEVSDVNVVVGIYADPPMIDLTSNERKTVILVK